jgi:hypothetical protein
VLVLEPTSRADRWVWNKEDIMAKQNHGIVQDERGQDQPTSKNAAHRNEPTMPRDAREVDPQDVRDGVYDPFSDEGKPRPAENDQPRGSPTGADVRPKHNPSHEEPRRAIP